MHESIVFCTIVLRVRYRKESSRSLSYLLTSYLFFLWQSANCALVSGLRECPLLTVNKRKVQQMALLRLRKNIFMPVRSFAHAAEGSEEGIVMF